MKGSFHLQRLPFGDIVLRMQELLILLENLFRQFKKYVKLTMSILLFKDKKKIDTKLTLS